MSSSFMHHFGAKGLSAFALLLTTTVAACHGQAAGKAPDAASTSESCTPPPTEDGGAPAYDALASGEISGQGVSATFCNASVQAVANGTDAILITIDTTVPFASTDVTLPAGSVGATLSGSFQLLNAAPGVYTSANTASCNALNFSYGSLEAADASCVQNADQSCPTGCTSSFVCGADAQTFQCCVPLAKTYLYQTLGPASCNGTGTAISLGSWTLTLKSVTPYAGDAGPYGPFYYIVHGTLGATLEGTADATEALTLSLSF